jgi:Domain of unknown function (DUF1707)
VTIGPGDEMAAAGCGPMRASDVDREQVIGMLKVAFVQGRLTKDELDLRVSQAFTARTYAELALVTAGIPAGQTEAHPPREPAEARGWPPMNSSAKTAAGVIIAATMMTVALWLVAWFAGSGALLAGAVCATGVDLVILCATGANLLERRQQKRSGGALPPSSSRRSARTAAIARRDGWPGKDALCAVRLAPNARPA